MAIYQLSEFQYETLTRAANSPEDGVAMVMEPNPDDSSEMSEKLTENIAGMGTLVQLGFFEDRTHKVINTITEAKLRSGRGFKAYFLAKLGRDMFHGIYKRRPN